MKPIGDAIRISDQSMIRQYEIATNDFVIISNMRLLAP